MVANDAGDYKTVASTIDFGGLDDNLFPSTKKVLLARILDFFGLLLDDNVSSIEVNNGFYCRPNPASGKATFVFNNQKGDEVSIDIFDLNGNVVKTIFEGKKVYSGKNSITIDLTDTNGKPFSNGIYLCRLKTGQSTNILKLVVVEY